MIELLFILAWVSVSCILSGLSIFIIRAIEHASIVGFSRVASYQSPWEIEQARQSKALDHA